MSLPISVNVETLEEEAAAVRTENISSGGVYFQCSSSLDIGTPVDFILTLPPPVLGGKPIRIKGKGKVMRVDRTAGGNGVGVVASIDRYEFLQDR